jgi:hypothetical protein
MQQVSGREAPSEAPLYVRWGADRSPYAIELKLELVDKIRNTLTVPDNKLIEIGGVLIGSLPNPYAPTLRIEDVEFIFRDPKDGASFMLDPSQDDRFASVSRYAEAKGRAAVGLFRTHLRPGALRPSIADRTLLTEAFGDSIYALLLVHQQDPFSAAFFVADGGQLPADPSVQEFRFDGTELRGLPEIEPEPPVKTAVRPPVQRKKRNYAPWLIGASAALLVTILFFYLQRSSFTFPALGRGGQLDLAISRQGDAFRVSWNHTAHDLTDVSGALLTVRRDAGPEQVELGQDELRLGAVEFQGKGSRVEVTLTLRKPGSNSVSQSAWWTGPSS